MTDGGALLRQLPDSMSDGIVLLDPYCIEDAEEHHLGEDEEMRRRFDADRPATLEETRRAVERWVAGRALDLLSAAAREVPGLNRLEARISPDNRASLRVAEKAAFVYAGTEQEELPTGALRTMLLYVNPVRGP